MVQVELKLILCNFHQAAITKATARVAMGSTRRARSRQCQAVEMHRAREQALQTNNGQLARSASIYRTIRPSSRVLHQEIPQILIIHRRLETTQIKNLYSKAQCWQVTQVYIGKYITFLLLNWRNYWIAWKTWSPLWCFEKKEPCILWLCLRLNNAQLKLTQRR